MPQPLAPPRLAPQVSAPQSLPEHGVRCVFVELANTKLELLEPLGPGSPLAKFLQKSPAGGMCAAWAACRLSHCLPAHTATAAPPPTDRPLRCPGCPRTATPPCSHHICLEVPDIHAAVAHVGARIRLLDAQPRAGAHGLPVVFAHPKDMCGVLAEFEEVKKQ